MAHNPSIIDWSSAARRDVEQFMHDEILESLPSVPDRDALILSSAPSSTTTRRIVDTRAVHRCS